TAGIAMMRASAAATAARTAPAATTHASHAAGRYSPSSSRRIAATIGATMPSTRMTERTFCTAVRHDARAGYVCWVDVVVTGSVLLGGRGADVDVDLDGLLAQDLAGVGLDAVVVDLDRRAALREGVDELLDERALRGE